jgi:hypothetical protein
MSVSNFFDLVLSDLDEINDIDCDIIVRIGGDFEFSKKRDQAFTILPRSKGTHIIVVAPKLVDSDDSRIQAVMRHEIAHALFHHDENFNHSEQDADDLAESIWGDRIYYDDDDVQTLDFGKYPRPEYLHQ